jgi:hypothetical protein
MVTVCPSYHCSNHIRYDSSVLSIHWDSVAGSMLPHRSRSRLTHSEQMTAILKPFVMLPMYMRCRQSDST